MGSYPLEFVISFVTSTNCRIVFKRTSGFLAVKYQNGGQERMNFTHNGSVNDSMMSC